MSADLYGTRLVPVAPRDRCARCDHEARVHVKAWDTYVPDKTDWHCRKRVGTDWDNQYGTAKEIPLYCPCDGFVPKEAA